MNRIAIVGCGGAGKSTLARRLGEILRIEVVHLDRVMWKAGWQNRPQDEEDALLAEIVARPRWIIDGNYTRTMGPRLAAADTVIFLDLPTWICLWRVVRRRLAYRGRTRPDMAEGCIEQLHPDFVRWIWGYRRTVRPGVMRKLEQYAAGKRVHVVTSPLQAERLLRQVRRRAG